MALFGGKPPKSSKEDAIKKIQQQTADKFLSNISQGTITSDQINSGQIWHGTPSWTTTYPNTGGGIYATGSYDTTHAGHFVPPTPDVVLQHLEQALGVEVKNQEEHREFVVSIMTMLLEGDFPEQAQATARDTLKEMGEKTEPCPRCEKRIQAKNDYLCRECR